MEYGGVWLPLVFASAALLGFYDISRKDAVSGNSALGVLCLSSVSGAVFFAAASLISGTWAQHFACPLRQWWLILVKAVIISFSWGCEFTALKRLPISIAAPVRSSAPLWTLLGAMLVFGEIPSPARAAGMASAICGYIILSYAGTAEGFPLCSSSMLLMILGTLLGAGSAIYDKFLINTMQIPPGTVQAHFSLDMAVIYTAAAAAARIRPKKKLRIKWKWTIPVTGIALIASDCMYFRSVNSPGAQISVISLLRRSSCIISFLAGAALFREQHILRKAFALILIFIGIIPTVTGGSEGN